MVVSSFAVVAEACQLAGKFAIVAADTTPCSSAVAGTSSVAAEDWAAFYSSLRSSCASESSCAELVWF